MPVVGADVTLGYVVRTVCSYWEWDYTKTEVAPATSRHQFLQSLRDGMEWWVQLGPLSSDPNGTFCDPRSALAPGGTAAGLLLLIDRSERSDAKQREPRCPLPGLADSHMRLIGWAVAFNSSRERTYQRPFLSHREASVSHRADRRPELPFTPGENLSEDGSARPPRWPPQ